MWWAYDKKEQRAHSKTELMTDVAGRRKKGQLMTGGKMPVRDTWTQWGDEQGNTTDMENVNQHPHDREKPEIKKDVILHAMSCHSPIFRQSPRSNRFLNANPGAGLYIPWEAAAWYGVEYAIPTLPLA